MATDVVQFRFSSAELDFLRSQGVNPNEFARDRMEEAVRALHAVERSRRLVGLMHGVGPTKEVDPARIIREVRDER